MKTQQAPVMSARLPNGGYNLVNGKRVRVKVGDVSYIEYDSMDEAIRELGQQKCLDFVNAQTATNAKNTARAAAVGGPSEKDLMNEVLAKVAGDSTLMAQYAACAGDKARCSAFMAKQLEDLKAEKGIVEDDEAVA